MNSTSRKEGRLKDYRLYLIVENAAQLEKVISNQNTDIKLIVQLRNKVLDKKRLIEEAEKIKRIIPETFIFIINDFVDVALNVDAHGVHLGQEDIPADLARQILGKDKIIGLSCHNLRQVKEAQTLPIDYFSIGPVFPTPTKPNLFAVGTDWFEEVKKYAKKIFFAIGGINLKNVEALRAQGISRIAIHSVVCQARRPDIILSKLQEKIDDSTGICTRK